MIVSCYKPYAVDALDKSSLVSHWSGCTVAVLMERVCESSWWKYGFHGVL